MPAHPSPKDRGSAQAGPALCTSLLKDPEYPVGKGMLPMRRPLQPGTTCFLIGSPRRVKRSGLLSFGRPNKSTATRTPVR